MTYKNQSKFGKEMAFLGLAAIISAGTLAYSCGGRHTAKPQGNSIELELPKDYDHMINVSSGGTERDLMITYETIDGKVKTQEYNSYGLFETSITWKKQ